MVLVTPSEVGKQRPHVVRPELDGESGVNLHEGFLQGEHAFNHIGFFDIRILVHRLVKLLGLS